MTTTLTATDLFSGGGGATQGMTEAGLHVVTAADHWPLAARVATGAVAPTDPEADPNVPQPNPSLLPSPATASPSPTASASPSPSPTG